MAEQSATALIETFELAIDVYHDQTTYAAGRMPTSAPGSMYHNLYPVAGNPSDYWRVHILWGELWEPGWRTFRLALIYGGGDQLTGGFLPGVMFTGEPSDAPSEILHFRIGDEWFGGPHAYHNTRSGIPCQQCARGRAMAGVWRISLRRSA